MGQTTNVTSPGADLSGRNKREAVRTIPEVHSCCWETCVRVRACLSVRACVRVVPLSVRACVRACVCVCVCVCVCEHFSKFIVDTDDAFVQRKLIVDIVRDTGRDTGVQAETRGYRQRHGGTGRDTGFTGREIWM